MTCLLDGLKNIVTVVGFTSGVINLNNGDNQSFTSLLHKKKLEKKSENESNMSELLERLENLIDKGEKELKVAEDALRKDIKAKKGTAFLNEHKKKIMSIRQSLQNHKTQYSNLKSMMDTTVEKKMNKEIAMSIKQVSEELLKESKTFSAQDADDIMTEAEENLEDSKLTSQSVNRALKGTEMHGGGEEDLDDFLKQYSGESTEELGVATPLEDNEDEIAMLEERLRRLKEAKKRDPIPSSTGQRSTVSMPTSIPVSKPVMGRGSVRASALPSYPY